MTLPVFRPPPAFCSTPRIVSLSSSCCLLYAPSLSSLFVAVSLHPWAWLQCHPWASLQFHPAPLDHPSHSWLSPCSCNPPSCSLLTRPLRQAFARPRYEQAQLPSSMPTYRRPLNLTFSTLQSTFSTLNSTFAVPCHGHMQLPYSPTASTRFLAHCAACSSAPPCLAATPSRA
eukprot:3565496-Pleurochrysis_carterae.AAC.1